MEGTMKRTIVERISRLEETLRVNEEIQKFQRDDLEDFFGQIEDNYRSEPIEDPYMRGTGDLEIDLDYAHNFAKYCSDEEFKEVDKLRKKLWQKSLIVPRPMSTLEPLVTLTMERQH